MGAISNFKYSHKTIFEFVAKVVYKKLKILKAEYLYKSWRTVLFLYKEMDYIVKARFMWLLIYFHKASVANIYFSNVKMLQEEAGHKTCFPV